jgi:superfamily I DNA/RNA helicase
MQADLLLDPTLSDVDGNVEDRRGTKSAFNGPPPIIMALETEEEEQQVVCDWIRERVQEGMLPEEIAVFVRSTTELARAKAAVEQTKLPYKVLDENAASTTGLVSISTMHNAKGLEYKAVAVMACDTEVIPLQQRIETVTDPTDLDEVLNTERHLLYVACTRARDYLLVTSGGEASEFLEDLKIEHKV